MNVPKTRGECNSPVVPESFLSGEVAANNIDDNGNGLIDENAVHVPFGTQRGVGFADYIDNDEDGEQGAPVITAEMAAAASIDTWLRLAAQPSERSRATGEWSGKSSFSKCDPGNNRTAFQG